MTDDELLSAVKTKLLAVGSYNDAILLQLTLAAKDYLLGGGIKEELIYTHTGLAAVALYVQDNYILESGETKFSESFNMHYDRLYTKSLD